MKNFILCLAMFWAAGFAAGAEKTAGPGLDALRGCRGTYNSPPRLANTRVDLPRLIDELVELRVNTYNYLIWHQPTDWEDLQAFLPLAREKKIKVWVSLIPPSEAKTRHSEPYREDTLRWAEEIAKLSVKYPNLVAWSIDDFWHNPKFYTPEVLRAARAKTRAINPRLAFVPCVYFKQVTPAFAKTCGGLVDGILFPYRSESTQANLTDPAQVAGEIAKIREIMGRPGLPVILDIYATGHSRLGPSTPEYVRQVMENGKAAADGILIYCHQDKVKAAEKYNIIKTLFNQWAGEGALPGRAGDR